MNTLIEITDKSQSLLFWRLVSEENAKSIEELIIAIVAILVILEVGL